MTQNRTHLLQNATVSQGQPLGRDEQDEACCWYSKYESTKILVQVFPSRGPSEKMGACLLPLEPQSQACWVELPHSHSHCRVYVERGQLSSHVREGQLDSVSLAKILVRPKA